MYGKEPWSRTRDGSNRETPETRLSPRLQEGPGPRIRLQYVRIKEQATQGRPGPLDDPIGGLTVEGRESYTAR